MKIQEEIHGVLASLTIEAIREALKTDRLFVPINVGQLTFTVEIDIATFFAQMEVFQKQLLNLNEATNTFSKSYNILKGVTK